MDRLKGRWGKLKIAKGVSKCVQQPLVKRRDKTPYQTPFPVELWIPILTEAMRPLLFLDPYCFSSNMEDYYQTIATDNPFAGCPDDGALRTRLSLRLVCRQFNQIIKTIPKRSFWVVSTDNDPRLYRAPVPQWSATGKWERINLLLDFETPGRVIALYPPVTTFHLFVRRKSQPSDPLYEMAVIGPASDVISQSQALKVLHLRLDFCLCWESAEIALALSSLSHLTTLSLRLGTSNIRDIIYEPLSLPNLRVLFLDFPVYGVGDTALASWAFQRLSILSLNLRIARHGVESVPSMPVLVSSFIEQHGSNIYGLRLLPGLWSAPCEDKYLTPMESEAERRLWDALPELRALSTDFTHFATTALKKNENGHSFRNMVTLNQIGGKMSLTLGTGLMAAITQCTVLEDVSLSFPGPPLDYMRSNTDEKKAILALADFCADRDVLIRY